MITSAESSSLFTKNIEQAVHALQEKNYDAAQDYIKRAMLENYHAPEVQNLFGVLEEFIGDLSLARKHYRASYALDPTFKPAIRNLERITSSSFSVEKMTPDFGDKPEIEEVVPYVVEYDEENIGHLRKKKMKNSNVS